MIHTNQFLDNLNHRLKNPLPGWKAQMRLSPMKTTRYMETPAHAKEAGVMLLLSPDDKNMVNMTFIKRPTHNPHDKHSGQISFPGGKKEAQDKNLLETALRECEEEIGIRAADIQIVGNLSPLYVFVSNFYVQPVVGYLPYTPTYKLQTEEVDKVIIERVANIVAPPQIAYRDYSTLSGNLKNMPYYPLKGEILWGATAMITAEFVSLVEEITQGI